MINEGMEILESVTMEEGVNNVDYWGKTRGKLKEELIS
jgi:hypothetical protein